MSAFVESKEGRAALNVVFTRILDGASVPGLENPKETLVDKGLLKNGGANDEIKPSERTNIPRFLNRLLSKVVFVQISGFFCSPVAFSQRAHISQPAGNRRRKSFFPAKLGKDEQINRRRNLSSAVRSAEILHLFIG